MVQIELVYAPNEYVLERERLTLPTGTTVVAALEASHWLLQYPEIQALPKGVFSKQVADSHILENGDRLEIYRPLLIDPKEKRRRKAKSGR